jgi:hypothetical protein
MKPFRQGNMDATCGLYAIVNSVRLSASCLKRLSVVECKELYQCLVHVSDQFEGGFAGVLCEGLGIREMKVLLKHADCWLLDRQEMTLEWSKPYTSRQRPDLMEYRTQLQDHLELGGTAILGLGGWWEDHWTVLHKLTAKSVMLCDSGGLKRLFSDSLNNPKGEVRSRWVIDATSTFLIKVDRDPALGWGA